MSQSPELPDLDLPATTDAAREYLVEWHRENLTAAPYFTDYISKALAGDFAYHLARWLARRAQPEGEAPQAKVTPFVSATVKNAKLRVALERIIERPSMAVELAEEALATPAAQHAESADDVLERELNGYAAITERQLAELDEVSAQQAAAPGTKPVAALTDKGRAVLWNDSYATEPWLSRGYRPLYLAAPSAPGTPEAPPAARPKRLTEEEVRELALQHLHDDTESAGQNGFFTFSAEGLDGFAIDLMDSQRAAQLDGGQGEGA